MSHPIVSLKMSHPIASLKPLEVSHVPKIRTEILGISYLRVLIAYLPMGVDGWFH